MAALLALLALAQDTVHLTRSDERRLPYEAHLKRYAELQARLAEDPKSVVAGLDALIAELGDGPVECRLRIERMANVFGEPVDFLPYQLRARARMARSEWRAALADLDASIARKGASSKPYLERTLAALGEEVKADFAFERWDPAKVDVALARRIPPPADWLAAELRRAEAALAGLTGAPESKHAPARRALAWSDALQAPAEALRAKAATLLARRSRFTLQIAVSPFAEIVRVTRDGVALEPGVRHTPASLSLEAGEIEIALGSRTFRIAPGDVEDGRTYVLGGDVESGKLVLRPLAR